MYNLKNIVNGFCNPYFALAMKENTSLKFPLIYFLFLLNAR